MKYIFTVLGLAVAGALVALLMVITLILET